MIVDRDTISEIRRHGQGCVVVKGDPPEVGSVHWVREPPLPKAPLPKPVGQVRVLDRWEVDGGFELLVEPVKDEFTLPKAAPAEEGPTLSAEHRAQLLEGEPYEALTFDDEPDLVDGDVYVLQWRPKRVVFDETGATTTYEAEPLWLVTFKKPVRKARGGWTVDYDVTDVRQRLRFLRRFSAIDLAAPEPDITPNGGASLDGLELAPTDWDDTRLHEIAEAREKYRHLHDQRDRDQETRMVIFRFRSARARAKELGFDDSAELEGMKEWLAELERRLEAA